MNKIKLIDFLFNNYYRELEDSSTSEIDRKIRGCYKTTSDLNSSQEHIASSKINRKYWCNTSKTNYNE